VSSRTFEQAVLQLQMIEHAPERVAQLAADPIRRLIEAGFAAGADPYGAPWSPLAASTLRRGRRPPPLTDTGATRSSVAVRAFGPSLVATVEGAADFHNPDRQGRQILPSEARGLPASWEQAIRDVASSVEREVA
jgi:hypothetical protein